MKINEVEALAGISKKNIRFYEAQGLLSPRRNAENGYREYGDEDVDILRRIRLLRKLDVPIEDIRKMQDGTHTVGDGMRRHLVSLERQRRNLEQSIQLCQELQNAEIPVSQLNAGELLERMEAMEQAGTSFVDTVRRDVRVRYIAPVMVAAVMVLLMTGFSGLILWAAQTAPEEAPPVWFMVMAIGIFAAVGVGTVLALLQRIREIGKGEIDDARHY